MAAMKDQRDTEIACVVAADVLSGRKSYADVALEFGLTRQRVLQIAKSRGVWVPREQSMPEPLTCERLKLVISYDPRTGIFTWARNRRSVRAGDVAGCVDREGYIKISVFDRTYRAGRLAWLYMMGDWPRNLIDHKNGNRSDNSWENLREAEHWQNSANAKLSVANASGYRGVSYHVREQKWQAAIQVRNSARHLGFFNTPEAAAARYQEEEIKLRGEFGAGRR